MPFSGNLLKCLQTCVAFLCLVHIINGKICGEIDVRNNPSELEPKLRNCTTVIGSISIVLIEKLNQSDFSKYSFPELQEITGYLLFFRVLGLKSLRNLFPNLSIIRGERLISHYALIIYELNDLTEIGLTSLIKIDRGYVMVRDCPVLCYIHTINWDAITQIPISGGFGNYLDFKSFNACPTTKACPSTCPLNYCWNNKHCQLFDTRISGNLTCHEECIGGCNTTDASGCKLCRNFRSLESNMCVFKCPKDQYEYSKLCVSAEYCAKRKKKAILGECRDSCPLIIMEKMLGNIENIEQCARECPGTEVDSLATSDLLRGCQIVRGDINIRLQSGVANTMQILERNLGDIEEIEGVLKIYRSPTITSLSFFKKLRIIRGISSENSKYTFIMLQNENLQELWDFNDKKALELSKGNLLVHFNSKLCLKQIHELQKLLKTNTSKDFIGPESNGYEQTCSAIAIATTYKVLSSTSVKISWEKIEVSASEKIIGYLIFYIVAPSKNDSHIGVDTCVQYGWQTHFIQNLAIDPNSNSHSTEIYNLTQNTQYGYYVKTQVVPKYHEEEVFGVSQGQSNIEYFTTEADAPTYPEVLTLSKTNVSLTLAWSPMNDNELIEYYKVDVFIQPDEHGFIDSRNYCFEPKIDTHVSVGVELNENPTAVYKSCNAEYENWRISHPDAIDPEYEWRKHRKAVCAEQSSRLTHTERQQQIMKYVTNHKLHSCIDGRNCYEHNDFEADRFSRQIHSFVKLSDNTDPNMDNSDIVNLGSNYLFSERFDANILNTTFIGFLPYTMYIFQFFSCNKISCSSYFLYYDRTDSSINADEISLTVRADEFNSNKVHLYFSEPPVPNGLTVAFQIEKHDLSTFKITTYCVSRKQHYANDKTFTFGHLNKGKYGFKVRSISLAMTGSFTDIEYITVYDQSYSIMSIIGIVFLFALFTILVSIVIIYFYRRFRLRLRVHSLNASTQNIMLQMDEIASGSLQDEEAPSFYHAHDDRELF